MYLFIYTVAVFGLAFIVGQSQISLPLRTAVANRWPIGSKWPLELIECPACFATWVGYTWAACDPYSAAQIFGFNYAGLVRQQLFIAFVVAIYSCGSSAIIGLLTKLMPVDSGELRMPPETDSNVGEDEAHKIWRTEYSHLMTWNEFQNRLEVALQNDAYHSVKTPSGADWIQNVMTPATDPNANPLFTPTQKRD